MDLKHTYNKIAKDWHNDHQTDTWSKAGVDKFISLMSKGDLILDAGCGSGMKSKLLIDNCLKVIGIDISENMIEIARKDVPAAKFFEMDIREAAKLKETFDGIFAQASILHIPKKEAQKTLEVLANKLKIGGYFYIAVKEKRGVDEEIKKENDYGYEYERFFSYYTIDEIKVYFTDLKMNIVYETVTNSGRTNWIQVIAQKS